MAFKQSQGYAPVCLGLEDSYIRCLYLQIQDCFGRPIASASDTWFDVVESLEQYSNDNNKTLSTFLVHVPLPSTELEEYVANFVQKRAAIFFWNDLCDKSCHPACPDRATLRELIISDLLNHNFIVNGARGSGPTIRVFQLNIHPHTCIKF
ncbi:hypothetical protein L6164_014907 [Bauhinia variegata]|uniref:Uncharacterized protein n=1 Tax=Bauhinia variegata TaxID=167791 RepID=A0ACB9NIN6_BAUVA|nr:hypothetical protein L6164_014907 [Bauhinia variegata]